MGRFTEATSCKVSAFRQFFLVIIVADYLNFTGSLDCLNHIKARQEITPEFSTVLISFDIANTPVNGLLAKGKWNRICLGDRGNEIIFGTSSYKINPAERVFLY